MNLQCLTIDIPEGLWRLFLALCNILYSTNLIFCQDQKKPPTISHRGLFVDSTIPGFYNIDYLTAGGFILARPLHCSHNQHITIVK